MADAPGAAGRPPDVHPLEKMAALGPAIYAPRFHLIIGGDEIKAAFGDWVVRPDGSGGTRSEPRFDALVALPWRTAKDLHDRLGEGIDQRAKTAPNPVVPPPPKPDVLELLKPVAARASAGPAALAGLGRAVYASRFQLLLNRHDVKVAFGDVGLRADDDGRTHEEVRFDLLVALPWPVAGELRSRLGAALESRRLDTRPAASTGP